MIKNTDFLVRLVCKRNDKELFGLAIYASSVRHALAKAKKLLEGSGYSVYPMGGN